MSAWTPPSWLRRRRPRASPSRLQGSTVQAETGLESSHFAGDSAWLSTGLAGESRWAGAPLDDAQRWRRQLNASRRWAIWGGVLGLVLGGLLFAPAQWAADAVARASGGHLLLAEASGSIWNGSAVPVLTGGPGSRDAAALPGRLHWTLRPGWTGLTLETRQPCCLNGALRLQLQPSFNSYTLRVTGAPDAASGAPAPPPGATNDLGQWPTAWLAGLGTPWNTLQLRGLMHLGSPGLTLQSSAGRWRMDGQLALELRDLSSRLSPLPVLGSYRLVLQGQGEGGTGTQLTLHTLSGPLELQGNGLWRGERLRFRGQASAAAGSESALANLLNIIGRRQGALSVISIG